MRIESGTARTAAGVIALIGWVGLALQFSSTTEQVGSAAGAVWVMLRYFTILTNVLTAVVFTGVALGRPAFQSQSLLGLVTLSILFVGVVYNLLLRGLVELSGGAATADLILHYIVPILAPLFWLLCAPKGSIPWRHAGLWAVYPLAYMVYALTRGASDGRYPYPFMDVPKVGWSSTLTTIAIMIVAYLVVGFVLIWLGRLLGRSETEA